MLTLVPSNLAFLSHSRSPCPLLVSVSVDDHFPFPRPCPFGLLTSVSVSLLISGLAWFLFLSAAASFLDFGPGLPIPHPSL